MQIKFNETVYTTMYHNTTEYTPDYKYNMNISNYLIKVGWLLRKKKKKYYYVSLTNIYTNAINSLNV